MKTRLFTLAACAVLLMLQTTVTAQSNGQEPPRGAQAFKQVRGPVKLVVFTSESGTDSTSFDPAGHILHENATLNQTQSGASSVWSFRLPAGEKIYTYDASGRLSEFVDADGTRYHDFVYNAQDQLESYFIGDKVKHVFTYTDGALERLTIYDVASDALTARPDNIFLDDATIYDENGNWTKTDCWGAAVSERVIEYYNEWEI